MVLMMNKLFLSVSLFSLIITPYAQADIVHVGDYFHDDAIGKSPTHYIKRVGAQELRESVGESTQGKAIVIDNYLDPSHTDLAENLTTSIITGQYESGMCPSHGTFTTGVVRNLVRDGEIKFISRYECGVNGTYVRTDESVARAIKVAAQSSGDVVNMSFGLGSISRPIFEAMQEVVDSGKVIFLAFGNGGGKNKAYLNHLIKCVNDPRMKGRVILVGNLMYDDLGRERLNPSSDYVTSQTPHAICAPGTDILSTAEGGTYTIASGTSAAAPVATGAYLLLMRALPGLTPDQYIQLLKDSARRQSINESYLFGVEYGNGALDLNRAYELGVERYGSQATPIASPKEDEPKVDAHKSGTAKSNHSSKQSWYSWVEEKAHTFRDRVIKPVQKTYTTFRGHPTVQKYKNNIQTHVAGLFKAGCQSVKSTFSSWMGW